MQTGKTRYHRIVWSASALVTVLALAVVMIGCLRADPMLERPFATLHEKNDAGYIPVSAQPLDISIRSPQAFVYDCEAGEIVYRKGEERVVYPASTTKLLTILCALEYLSPDEIVTPGDELSLVGAGSSIAYVKENHTLSVEMLIEGMLLPSGNDAAYALAAAAGHRIDPSAKGKEAVAAFMREMVAYGERIGLVGTCFTTPDGLAGEEHYSTVEDIILIARMAMQNEVIRRYAALHEDDVTYASGHTNHWINTNAMLDPDSPWYHSAVKGLKTGSLENNYCLIATVEQEGRAYIIGVFGARQKTERYADVLTVLDVLFPLGEVVR